jgi:hypothetical protein
VKSIRATTQVGEALLAAYDVHYVDSADTVINALTVEHDSDDAAIEHARRINIPSIGAGFDVVRDGRLVHRHRRHSGRRH